MALVKCYETFYEVVENTARDLYIKALKDLPPDVRSALAEAKEKETSATARETLNIILKNIEIADRENMLICQDTGIPIVHYDFIEGGQYLELLMIPKGSGSENMSFLKMLVPADGIAGLKKFIIDSVVEAGGKPCPPGIVGVGIGGTADLAVTLAKKAISRPVGSSNPCTEIAQLEDELLRAINSTGIGLWAWVEPSHHLLCISNTLIPTLHSCQWR